MVFDSDVFDVSMVRVIFGEEPRCVVVAVEGYRVVRWKAKAFEEFAKEDYLFASMV